MISLTSDTNKELGKRETDPLESRSETSNNVTEAEGRNCLYRSLTPLHPTEALWWTFWPFEKSFRCTVRCCFAHLWMRNFRAISSQLLSNFPSSFEKFVSLIQGQSDLDTLATLRLTRFFSSYASRTCENFLTTNKWAKQHPSTGKLLVERTRNLFKPFVAGAVFCEHAACSPVNGPHEWPHQVQGDWGLALTFKGWALKNTMHKVALQWSKPRSLIYFPKKILGWQDWCLAFFYKKQTDSDVVCSTSLCWKLQDIV